MGESILHWTLCRRFSFVRLPPLALTSPHPTNRSFTASSTLKPVCYDAQLLRSLGCPKDGLKGREYVVLYFSPSPVILLPVHIATEHNTDVPPSSPVKKAYRKAALRTHPDRVPADQKKQAEDAFRAINAAYEILSNEGNRTLYDKHGVWPPPASSSSKSKPYKTKTREPEYRPMQNPYESDAGGAAYQHFVFTDPFALFNMIFADMYQQQQVGGFVLRLSSPCL